MALALPLALAPALDEAAAFGLHLGVGLAALALALTSWLDLVVPAENRRYLRACTEHVRSTYGARTKHVRSTYGARWENPIKIGFPYSKNRLSLNGLF